MADFNAQIGVSVQITKALQGIEKLEARINKIKDTVIDVKIARATDGANEFKKLGNSFKRLAQTIKTAGVVTAVAAVTGSLQSLNNLPVIGGGLDTSALGKVVSQLGALSNAAVDAAAAAPTLSVGLAAATAAVIAFAPQIARATKDTLLLARAGAEAAVPLKQLTELLATATVGRAAFGGEQLVDAANFAEIYRQRLFEVSNTVTELTRKQKVLASTLDKYNSGTDTAAKIAGRLVQINQQLNAELREQKDLLRQVSGVNVTELEASKGRNSIETRKAREAFLDKQSGDKLEVKRALQRLDERGISALEQELNLNKNIVNTKRDELKTENDIQRRVRTSAQRKLTGDRQFGPAGDPQSIQQAGANREKRIRDATATAIEADRKWLQAREQGLIEAAQRGLTAELDSIDTILQAQIKADNAAQANWDARFKARVQAETVREKARLSADNQRARRNKLYEQEEENIKEKAKDTRKASSQRLSRFGEDLALGAGFPLLFGAGPGGIAGGVAGALAGGGKGGFGLQILLSALGTQLDTFVADLSALGGALTEVTGFASVATEKLLLSSKAREKELKTIQKLGFSDLADSLAKTDFENKFGKQAVDNLENLAKEFDEAGRSLATLTTSLGAFVAGPLAAFLKAINEGNTKDQAAKEFSIARRVAGNRRIKAEGATTPEAQLKIRQDVYKQFETVLQKIVKEKKEELELTVLSNGQKAEAYAQAQKELTLTPPQLKGEAAARTALAGLDITQQLQSAEKTVFDIAKKYGNIQKKQQEQQADYDRQRVDIVRSYEQSIAQTRENVEQRILSLRIQGIQKANEIENQRAANQLSTLQAANSAAARQQQESDVAAGTRPELAATGQKIDNAFRAIAEAELSTEQQKAQIKRDAAFEVLKLELDGEKFKIDVAKEVSKLNLATARSIERINIGIAKKNEDFSQKKFNIEKQIALTQLEVIKQENVLLGVQVQASGLDKQAKDQWLSYLEKVSKDIYAAIATTTQAKAPGKLSSLAPVGGEGVSTDGADVALNNLIERQRLLTAERLKDLDVLRATNKEAELGKVSQVRIEEQATINGLLTEQLDALNAQQRILELQKEGRSEAQAVAIQQVETTLKLVDANLGVAEAKLKAELAALEGVEADQRDLEIITKVREELEKINTLRGGLPAKQQQAVEKAAKLNEGLTETEQLATDIAGTLGNGITDALVLAVSGTENLGEAFQALAADILQAIGKALILQAVTAAIGGFGTGGKAGSGLLGLIQGRATGGPVSGGTPYIVGEEGPELFIPGVTGTVTNNDQFEAARSAMGGGNNSSNDAFADNAEAIGTTNSYTKERMLERERIASINSNPIDVRAETTVINNVEYVTAEQFSQGMKSTARDAQAKVLSDLRNRPSIRRQVGVG